MVRRRPKKSLKDLKPPWEKGHCPNPGGRPKTKPLLAALQQELAENPERLIEIVDKVLTHAKNSFGDGCAVIHGIDNRKPFLSADLKRYPRTPITGINTVTNCSQWLDITLSNAPRFSYASRRYRYLSH
jgi:hypothetical protein